MDTQHSASSALPWIWVIEALAHVKEVDMSVLTELVARTPEIADDVGQDARNILHLRCLEALQEQNPNAMDDEGIRQNLPSMEGSDLNSYIQNKRRSLPECALKRLKNLILEDLPVLEPLKKISGLSKSDLTENKTSLNGLKGKERVPSGQSLQDPIKIDHVSSRFKRIDPTSKDKLPEHLNDGNSPQDESDSQLHIGKKAKNAAAVSKKNEATEYLLLSAMVSNELSKNLVETDSKTTGVSKSDSPRSKEEDSHDDGSEKNNFSKEENNDHPIGLSVCSLGDRTKMKCGETEGDSDGFDDEEIDIEMEKQRFLKSQGTFSEDTELNLCIECNRDGQLLICSTRSCTIGVHPSCWSGYVDAPSQFYCPFCSYSNAISEHLEAKKQSSLAREMLNAFINFEIGANVGSECGTEDNLRGEEIRKKDDYEQAHSNLCREPVVYVEEEAKGEVSQTVVSSQFNKPREQKRRKKKGVYLK